MANAATKSLGRKTTRRTRDRNRRVTAFWVAIDAWTRRVERDLLGVVAAGRGGTRGVLAAVDDILDDLGADGAAVLESGLRRAWRWSWESATADFVAGVPLTTWIRRLMPLKTLLGTEAAIGTDGAALLEFETGLATELELQRIIDGKVSQTKAREIVRKIEFPPPSSEKVDQILAATNDPDGLSAMDRIKTVAQRDKQQLRQTIVSALSEPDRAAAMEGLNKRVRQFLDPGKGLNYKARRIARTESVRIAEAGQREAWSEAEDMIEGIEWHCANVPDSAEYDKSLDGQIFTRTGAGEYVNPAFGVLPTIPIHPNCMCYTSPVLSRDLTKGLPPRKLGAYEKPRIPAPKVKPPEKLKPAPKPRPKPPPKQKPVVKPAPKPKPPKPVPPPKPRPKAPPKPTKPIVKPPPKPAKPAPKAKAPPKPKPKPAPPKPAKAELAIRKGEAQIVGGTKETGIVYDSKGNELFRRTGGKDIVEFSSSETAKLRGTTMTHNHPTMGTKSTGTIHNLPLSGEDGYMMAEHGLAEVRAVGRDFTYSLKPRSGITPDAKKMRAAWRRRENVHYRKETSRLSELVRKGKMTRPEANRLGFMYQEESQHLAWRDVAKKQGLEYKRIPHAR